MMKESIHKLFAIILVSGMAGFSPASAADEDTTPLYKAMEEVESAIKSLRRLVRREDRWEASAAAIREGLKFALECHNYVPREIEALKDGPEKTKALADSRRLMGMMYVAMCELELAFLAEDEEAVEAATDKIQDIKKESHDKYYKEE